MKTEKNRDKNNILVISLIISAVAILLSIISLCISSPHIKQLDFDYQGITVDVLSLLVTVLIGWQIFNIIEFDRRIDKKINERENDLNERIVSQFNNKFINLDNKIINLDNKIINLDSKIMVKENGLTVYVDSLERKLVDSNRETVNEQNNIILNLENKIRVIENDLKVNVNSLEIKLVNSNRETVNEQNNIILNLENKISTTEGKLMSMEGRVSTLENNTRLLQKN